MVETIRILIADDHPLVRCGIRETLRGTDDITLVGEASRGDEAQRLCRELLPDVLLLDLQMPGATAVETVSDVRAHCPQTRVIILTAYDDEVYVRRMLAEGAVGYVLKDEVTEVVLTAIQTAMQGGIWLSQPVLEIFRTQQYSTLSATADRQVSTKVSPLSTREREILDMVRRGLTDKEIAKILNIKERTVGAHLESIFHKLEVHSRTCAVATALEYGLLTTPSLSPNEGNHLLKTG